MTSHKTGKDVIPELYQALMHRTGETGVIHGQKKEIFSLWYNISENRCSRTYDVEVKDNKFALLVLLRRATSK